MREIKLSVVDPLRLTLAADARLSPTDYTNDQIWELLVGRGEPGAILLQTTYGLRARNMRVFPQFVEEHQKNAATEISIFGQESKTANINIGKMNLAVHGLSGDTGDAEMVEPGQAVRLNK